MEQGWDELDLPDLPPVSGFTFPHAGRLMIRTERGVFAVSVPVGEVRQVWGEGEVWDGERWFFHDAEGGDVTLADLPSGETLLVEDGTLAVRAPPGGRRQLRVAFPTDTDGPGRFSVAGFTEDGALLIVGTDQRVRVFARRCLEPVLLPLDDPRWSELWTVYGPGDGVPDLLRRMMAEREPDHRDGGAWAEAWSSLYHQGTVCSATIAAVPHLALLAETGTHEQAVAVIELLGAIAVRGIIEGPFRDELWEPYRVAMARLRRVATTVVRRELPAARARGALGDLLGAFGGLHRPHGGVVPQLDHLARDGVVEIDCLGCDRRLVVRPNDQGLRTAEPGGAPAMRPVDRRTWPERLARGLALRGCTAWTRAELQEVLAALAVEAGDRALGSGILDLSGEVRCPACGHAQRVERRIHALRTLAGGRRSR